MICLWSTLRCNTRVWRCSKFFLGKNLQQLSKPQLLQLHVCHIVSHSQSKHVAEFKEPAEYGESEMLQYQLLNQESKGRWEKVQASYL